MADQTLQTATLPKPRLPARPRGFRLSPGLNASTYVGIALVVVPLLAALLAPLLTGANPMALSGTTLRPPSWAHPMGTDDLGRDVLARVLYGGRISLTVGVFSALIAVVIGTAVGTVAGYFGGRTDETLMRLTEMFQIIPRFLLAIVVVALFGGGMVKIIVIIGALGWVGTARVVRAQLLVLRGEEFVQAAVMGGASPARMILRHILPNVVPFIIVAAALQTGGAILTESFLSFLGLGDPSQPSWGLLLQQAQLYLQQAWWMSTFPGVALSMTILGLNLMGDGLASKFGARKVAR
ncbi:MAG: ABC transporter permease [Rhizobiales bacterium]|nr:ABC transporter permease [Hyphomicrobiales bacterium]